MEKTARTVKDVFDGAHEIASVAERQAYVDQACAGDPELRQKVEALLRAHDEAGSFLVQPALPQPGSGPSPGGGGPESTGPYLPGNTPPELSLADGAATGPDLSPHDAGAADAGPGTRLGPYRLLEEVGHGGMGAVYLAEQEEPVRRRVALKIIKPGMDSAQVVARFEAERQALALMDHLNIARVLDAGATPEGRPYFVMELVQGVPITRYCDDNRLTVRERLELFVPVCQAIQHAHQKGIVHRDIKPSNVLVTQHEGKPFPKVIDFGIAKAIEQPLTDGSPETQVGTVVGTPEYMSPEQANLGAGGIDTRSDVYSLGVLLYELLTGTTPLGRDRVRTTPVLEVLRLIADEEPPRASARASGPGKQRAAFAERRKTEPAKLARLLRGDLDWIAVRALEKDRERRYGTAVGLAQDVQRYLTDEPVEACPPSRGYRLRKFARKHRALLAFAGGLVAMLVLAVVGLTVGLIVVNQAKRRAETAQANARSALDTTDAAVQALVRKGGTTLGQEQKDILRAVLEGYRNLASAQGDTQEGRVLAARELLEMANLAALIDERTEAEVGYSQVIQLYDGLTEEAPGVAEYRQQLARSHFDLGLLFAKMNQLAEAEAAMRRAAELDEKLVADFPAEPAYRSDLANDLNDLGVVLRERHQPAAAAEAYRRAIDIGKKLVAEFPGRPLYQTSLAGSYGNLGNIVRDQGQPEAALPWYGQVVELLGPIVAGGRPVANARLFLHNAHWDRANALGQLGRHAEAIKDWQQAIRLDEGPDRDSIRLFQETSREEERLKAIAPGTNEAASGGRFYAAAQLFASAAAEAAFKNEETLSTHYAGRALGLLERARTAGLFRDAQRLEELKKDGALTWLRQRPEFQKFAAGLEAGKGPK